MSLAPYLAKPNVSPAQAGCLPSNELLMLGAGGLAMTSLGLALRKFYGTAVNPGATAADNVLAVITVPANTLSADGVALSVLASGSFGANTNSKRVKIIVNPATAVVGSTVGTGGTTVADTGAVTTNGAGWAIGATIGKVGDLGANTQVAIHNPTQVGAAVSSLLNPSALTLTESSSFLIAITGNATTVATDIGLSVVEVCGNN